MTLVRKDAKEQYSGLKANLPTTLPRGSSYFAIDTHEIFMYDDNSLPILTNGSGIIDSTGWATYVDTQYTSGAPFSVLANTVTNLPNNAGNIIDSQKPSDITTFYDGTVVTGRNGDNLDLQIYFLATPTSANQWVEIWIDITGGTGTPANLANLYRQTFTFPKGAGTERGVVYALPSSYTLGTWEANGGVVKIESDAALTIHGITYNLDRSHKAR